MKCGWEPPSAKEFAAFHPQPLTRAALPAMAAPLTWWGPRVAEAQALYDRIPSRLKAHPLLGEILPDGGVFSNRVLKGKWEGFYDWRGRHFVLDEWSPHFFVHEVTHHLQVWGMPAKEWAEWEAFFRSHKGAMPSDYGRKNAAEGLAESVAVFVVEGPGEVGTQVSGLLKRLLGA